MTIRRPPFDNGAEQLTLKSFQPPLTENEKIEFQEARPKAHEANTFDKWKSECIEILQSSEIWAECKNDIDRKKYIFLGDASDIEKFATLIKIKLQKQDLLDKEYRAASAYLGILQIEKLRRDLKAKAGSEIEPIVDSLETIVAQVGWFMAKIDMFEQIGSFAQTGRKVRNQSGGANRKALKGIHRRNEKLRVAAEEYRKQYPHAPKADIARWIRKDCINEKTALYQLFDHSGPEKYPNDLPSVDRISRWVPNKETSL